MKNGQLVLFILNCICFVLACIWWFIEGGFEPITASITLLVTLIGQLILKKNKRKATMQQRSGKNSVNYQSGRDINIKGDVK